MEKLDILAHRNRIRELNGAVSVSAAPWIIEHFVNLHALGDSPIEPIREEFVDFLGKNLDRTFIYGDFYQRNINGFVCNGVILGGLDKINQLEKADAILGTYTQKGNSQIYGFCGPYGVLNTTCRVFALNSDKKMQDFLAGYRRDLSSGWKQEYAQPQKR